MYVAVKVISTVLLWSLFCWGWNNQDALCFARRINTCKSVSQTLISKGDRAKIINYEPLFTVDCVLTKERLLLVSTSECLENSDLENLDPDPKNSDPRVSRKLRPQKLRASGCLENSDLEEPRPVSRDSSGGYLKPDTTFRGLYTSLILKNYCV